MLTIEGREHCRIRAASRVSPPCQASALVTVASPTGARPACLASDGRTLSSRASRALGVSMADVAHADLARVEDAREWRGRS